jgi:linoleoyl-CoA desaturase
MAKVSFTNNNPSFTITLRKRVDEYFASGNHSLTGNTSLYAKTAILFIAAAAMYALLVFFDLSAWITIPLCTLMGLNLAAIGFNVMHDGAHGSYSKKVWVNEVMAHSLNLLGGCSYLWKVKHNNNHHSFTNIEGIDDDIDIQPWIRTNVNQPRKWFHRYQHIYWVFFYGLAYLAWVYMKDFTKYFSGKIATTAYKKMSTSQHIIFWTSKLVYLFIFVVLPIMMVGFVKTLVGYSIMSVVCGLTLSIIFQLAHVVEGSSFPLPAEGTNRVEEDWTIHQLATTANFSTRSKVMSWFAGGLNFQVEHHLFPRISHIHYPEINKVVKEVCAQFNVKYMEHPSFLTAVRSHVQYLKQVGYSA